MLITLSPEERQAIRQALGRLRRVTKVAMVAYQKAELETLTADARLGEIDAAGTAIECAGENEDVELIHLHRSVIRAGIRLILGDIEQTKSREANLGIDTVGSDDRAEELERIARKLGEQQELPLTAEGLGYPQSSQVGMPAAEVAA